MKWSLEQQAIIAATASGDRFQVRAGAGCGKTTTLIQALVKAPEPGALCVAFNKRIAEELSTRVPPNVEVRTFNSLGHRAWASHIRKRLKLNRDKAWDCLPEKIESSLRMDAVQLLGLVRAFGIVPDGTTIPHVSLLEDTQEEWESICDAYDINPAAIRPARQALRKSITLAFRGEIDFADQLYMPTLFGAPIPRFPLILIDEAQDTSALNARMLHRACSGRLIAIGDPNQAIYGFRGASTNAMPHLAKLFSATKTLPLMTTFRCPRAVVREAQKLVPDYIPGPNNPEGEVCSPSSWTLSDIPDRSAILCRNNAPLGRLAWKLLSEGRSVRYEGRELNRGLIRILDQLAPQTETIKTFLSRLSAWFNQQLQRYPRREASLTDRRDFLEAIATDCPDTAALRSRLKAIFENPGRITLSTIHKAKGLEWPEVFILDRDLIPSRFATSRESLQQEDNLLYVAITRAQERLTYINTEDLVCV